MNSMGLCILGVVLAIGGVNSVGPGLLDTRDFPSKFLGKAENTERLMDLMSRHFSTSLDYLFASKYYGSQSVERPGMAKLLSEQSDRHWEEGMDVLKKYLQLGGNTPDSTFLNSIAFSSENYLPNQTEPSHVKYGASLKRVMEASRGLVNTMTDLHHASTRKSGGNGDVDVAHFLQEKAKEESEVARKMAGYYITLQKMDASGIAVALFDKNL